MSTGKIGVTTENIFPVIKKFLYSDHEIFLRELVSNAVDATQKLKTLYSFGDYKGELGELDVRVTIDSEAGTLTVSDRGIGMDSEDIEKYINQIAFSGAEEFLEKYKDTANSIIGHFGLGFYSAFMVSKKVVIKSLSYKEGAKAVEWSCDGSPEYTMEECDKAERGTDVILYIDDEDKEFLEQKRIDTLLKKYCRFLPVPVISGKEQEWKDGKYEDTDKDKVINATEPLWTRKPVDLTDEDYLKFYRELMPGNPDPMFWIHLNVDYPFTLTGILYFPTIKSSVDIQKNKIQLYCNQVYVTDQVEGVVPEFLAMVQGVIDSPDIPLNVSRSYLQADSQVKKISTYITKKLAERLEKMLSEDRKGFEEKWENIKLVIEYGMLTDDKFYDQAKKFFLVKDVNGQYYTLEEYRQLIEAEQTDKDGNVIYLYASNKTDQFPYIKACEDKGYSVLLMDGQLDAHTVDLLERKLEKTRFVRVDSDIPERLIRKDETGEAGLTPVQTDILSGLFKTNIPDQENASFIVSFAALGENDAPARVTQNEFMRRMKDMNSNFYGIHNSYDLIINVNQPVVKKVLEDASEALVKEVEPVKNEIDALNKEISDARKEAAEKKEDMPDLSDKEKQVRELREKEDALIARYTQNKDVVSQIIDLALLEAHILSGKHLDEFIKRSVDLLKA